MQILQWLLKMSHESVRNTIPSSRTMLTDKETEVEDLVLSDQGEPSPDKSGCEKRGEECKDYPAIFLSRRDCPTCFYSSLSFKHLKSCYTMPHCLHPLKEEIITINANHKAEPIYVGSKVLPICDGTVSESTETRYHGDSKNSDQHKGDKRRTISRMKGLLRWAAAVKTEKGGNKSWKVLYFRNRGVFKGACDDMSSTSSKLSFKWDVGSCSGSSAYSPLSLASSSRSDWVNHSSNATVTAKLSISECSSKETCISPNPGTESWITTDSDCKFLTWLLR
ncbi:uncharacterized protein LOC18428602 isoform X1 [Amborella trichopoda]|uniref:uncharacterized protein LOC18428602 isoform X1 n=1 Tax=Amborella trichopoda TaxID=13333 RepID=UPI0009BDF6FC|nr:uncharacterized protein LOC18428602 isoform X1 [Amborella trichopoda]|eukprot:XP_020519518.1 uncharacterized protein LOC18428602 isoform X1 [Amborella trichopoda]